jgi:hypothetical protein
MEPPGKPGRFNPYDDNQSRKFSDDDIGLSQNHGVPVFIGNEAGDMQLFLRGMPNDDGRGIDLCRGCAK